MDDALGCVKRKKELPILISKGGNSYFYHTVPQIMRIPNSNIGEGVKTYIDIQFLTPTVGVTEYSSVTKPEVSRDTLINAF